MGFNGKNIAEKAAENRFLWAPVIYDPIAQNRILDAVLTDDFPDSFLKSALTNNESLEALSKKFLEKSLNFGPWFKQKIFEEEKEFRFWRIISAAEFQKSGKFRISNRGLVPYIDLNFGIDADNVKVIPKIMLTPGTWVSKITWQYMSIAIELELILA